MDLTVRVKPGSRKGPFGVARSKVTILRGESSRIKRVRVEEPG